MKPTTWIAAVLVLTLPAVCSAATMYSVTDIGSLGISDTTYGFAINAAGQITGYSSKVSPGGTHAFLYDGTMHDLGTLGGRSTGSGINSAGRVVGFYEAAPNTNRA